MRETEEPTLAAFGLMCVLALIVTAVGVVYGVDVKSEIDAGRRLTSLDGYMIIGLSLSSAVYVGLMISTVTRAWRARDEEERRAIKLARDAGRRAARPRFIRTFTTTARCGETTVTRHRHAGELGR